MESYKKFNPNSELVSEINHLESKREEFIKNNPRCLDKIEHDDEERKNLSAIIFSILFAIFVFIFYLTKQNIFLFFAIFSIIFAFIGGEIENFFKNKKNKKLMQNPMLKYKNFYKSSIIVPLLKEIDKDIIYSKERSIADKHKELLTPALKSGEDLIEFEVDGVGVDFGELTSEFKMNGKVGEIRHIVCVAKFNKNLTNHTLVTLGNRYTQMIFSSILNSKDLIDKSLDYPPKLIDLDNQAFNTTFATYTDDEVEARYILTHTMMERLMELKDKFSFVTFSFKNDKIIFSTQAVHGLLSTSSDYDLFDYTIHSDIYSQTKRHNDVINEIADIVKTLQLDSKIWR